jgi:hypothetical protein
VDVWGQLSLLCAQLQLVLALVAVDPSCDWLNSKVVLVSVCTSEAISICKYVIRIAQAKGTISQTNLFHVVKQHFHLLKSCRVVFQQKGGCRLTPQYVLWYVILCKHSNIDWSPMLQYMFMVIMNTDTITHVVAVFPVVWKAGTWLDTI